MKRGSLDVKTANLIVVTFEAKRRMEERDGRGNTFRQGVAFAIDMMRTAHGCPEGGRVR